MQDKGTVLLPALDCPLPSCWTLVPAWWPCSLPCTRGHLYRGHATCQSPYRHKDVRNDLDTVLSSWNLQNSPVPFSSMLSQPFSY
jgi:hypothetical protein